MQIMVILSIKITNIRMWNTILYLKNRQIKIIKNKLWCLKVNIKNMKIIPEIKKDKQNHHINKITENIKNKKIFHLQLFSKDMSQAISKICQILQINLT